MDFIIEVFSSFLGFIFAILSTLLLNWIYTRSKARGTLNSIKEELEKVCIQLDKGSEEIGEIGTKEIRINYHPYPDFVWKSIINADGFSDLKEIDKFDNFIKAYRLIEELNYFETLQCEIYFSSNHNHVGLITEHLSAKRANLYKYIKNDCMSIKFKRMRRK